MATSVDPEKKMEENEADCEMDAVQADSETDADQGQEPKRVTAIRKELEAIDQEQTPIAYELLNDQLRKEFRYWEIRRAGKRPSPPENPEFIRVDDKTIKLSQKILVPVERDPEFNFVGKIVGPKGANLKQIAYEHNVKLAIMGKGSSKERDPEKEKELSESGKPEFEHLKEPLYVRVDTVGHPSKVWLNMQGALDMLAHIVKPDEKDTAIQQQWNRSSNGRENGSKNFGPQGGFEESFGFGQPMMAPMRGRGFSMNPMMRNYTGGMPGFGKSRGRGGPRGRERGSPY